jgi:hypothetical protein
MKDQRPEDVIELVSASPIKPVGDNPAHRAQRRRPTQRDTDAEMLLREAGSVFGDCPNVLGPLDQSCRHKLMLARVPDNHRARLLVCRRHDPERPALVVGGVLVPAVGEGGDRFVDCDDIAYPLDRSEHGECSSPPARRIIEAQSTPEVGRRCAGQLGQITDPDSLMDDRDVRQIRMGIVGVPNRSGDQAVCGQIHVTTVFSSGYDGDGHGGKLARVPLWDQTTERGTARIGSAKQKSSR